MTEIEIQSVVTVAVLLVGVLIGGVVASWIYHLRLQSQTFRLGAEADSNRVMLQTRLDEIEKDVLQKNNEIARLESQVDRWQSENGELTKSNVELETSLTHERKQYEEKIELLKGARDELSHQFKSLASDILEEKSKRFTEQNQENLQAIVKPLREQIGEFRKRVDDVYTNETKDRQSLHNEIKNLTKLNQQIAEDAINLTKALKGQTKTQGIWGEVILERVLEQSGLVKGREYESQASFRSEDGRRYQPDVVVHLPEEKDVVVDSKVSLVAYERYVSTDDDVIRQAALVEHVNSMRNHVRSLSDKSYDDLPGLRSLDFVLMFVPIEAAFIVAVEQEQELFRDAFDRHIVVVTPSTLLVTLRTIQNIWRYEYQNRNAQEIARRAGQLYDKFVSFVESLDTVGSRIIQAQDAFDKARGQLVSGRGNLVGRTEVLKKLGASTKKSLPTGLLEDAAADLALLEDELPTEDGDVK